MDVLLSMVKKDFKLIFRDKMTVFFTFIFPVLFAAFFGSIFGGGGGGSNGLSVAVTDLDQSVVSQTFVQGLIDSDELRVEVMDEQAARDLTRRGKKVAYIIVPEGFGEKYGSLFTGGTPELQVGVDPARTAESGMLQGTLMKLGVKRFEDAFSNADAMVQQLDDSIAALSEDDDMPQEWKDLLQDYLPQMRDLTAEELNESSDDEASDNQGMADVFTPIALEFEDVVVNRDGPKNGYAVTIPQSMYWAIMGVIMGFGVSLVQEKEFGTMTRLVTAPLSRMQILGGKALGCFLATMLVTAMIFIFARVVFGVPLDSPLKLLMAMVSVAIGFMGIMMFIAAIGKTERGVSSLGWGVMMILAMFGGAMIPLFVMPGWMESVSNFSPVKWAILSFEGATWRAFSFQEMLLPCGIMLAIGIVFFLIATRTLKLEE